MWHILPFYVNFPEGARTGSWIGNQDPVLENRIMDWKPGRCPRRRDRGRQNLPNSARVAGMFGSRPVLRL